MTSANRSKTAGTRRAAALLAGCAWASLGLISAARPADAADTQLAWTGVVKVTASTPQCVASGIGGVAVGTQHVSVFRPKIRSTDTATFISIVSAFSALTFGNASEATVHQMHGAGNFTGTGINGKAKPFSFSGTYKFAISPATITAAIGEIGIVATINNYSGAAGCSVSFDAFYAPQP